MRERREGRERKKKKIFYRHTKAPIMTLFILLKRSQRYEFNNTK
jgi:hypothetical protein